MKQRNNHSFLKLLVGATLLLSAFAANAQTGEPKTVKPNVAELVLPTQISQNEPFIFAARGVVEGEVISVQTVEGEVVATKKTDKYGRVFLAAGLAAGSYLLTTGDGGSQKLGTIDVSNTGFNAADIDGTLSLANDTVAIDMSRFGVIQGNFPNIGNLDLDDFVSGRTTPILAATPQEIVFDRPANTGAVLGETTLTVRDSATGQSATTNVVFYSATAKLTNVKVPSGSETHLVVTVLPKELEGQVSATILGGPVAFANGEGEGVMQTSGGQADFPLQSQPGSAGKFDVSWTFSPTELLSKFWDPFKKIWEPARKGLKTLVWDPLKKKFKELDWGPPKVDGGAKKEDPPKVEEKKPEPPKKGGDTKALPPKWEPFKEVDKDGRVVREGMRKTESKDGVDTTTEIFKDGDKTVKKTVTVKGETRTTKTETTSATNGNTGVTEEVTETIVEKKVGGEWVVDSHTKKTVTIKGGKIIGEKTEVIKKPGSK